MVISLNFVLWPDTSTITFMHAKLSNKIITNLSINVNPYLKVILNDGPSWLNNENSSFIFLIIMFSMLLDT